MILYRYIAYISQTKTNESDNREMNLDPQDIMEINSHFFDSFKGSNKSRIVIAEFSKEKITMAAALDIWADVEECEKCIRNEFHGIISLKREEITTKEFENELVKARYFLRAGYEGERIINEMKLNIEPSRRDICGDTSYKAREKIYNANRIGKGKSIAQLSEILASDSFYEEMDRIYSRKNEKRFVGHPVHYLIRSGDKRAAENMVDVLIPALLKNKRLLSGRVCFLDNISSKSYLDENFMNIFPALKGGAVVVDLCKSQYEKDTNSDQIYEAIAELLLKMLKMYGNETLFIFLDIGGKQLIANDITEKILSAESIIQLNEGQGDLMKATAFLRNLADKTEYSDCKTEELIGYLSEEKLSYPVSEIYKAFDKWYSNGLKAHVYKAYQTNSVVRIEPKKIVNKPYEELHKMIGLSNVKKIIEEIIAMAKLQKIRKNMGLTDIKASMHMMFSGNPGTAKTTVARLLAQILKEEGTLSGGHLVECGRQDLVGKYLGWTAKNVEEKFKEARGGILFIDEAYSLVEERDQFASEAINAIRKRLLTALSGGSRMQPVILSSR